MTYANELWLLDEEKRALVETLRRYLYLREGGIGIDHVHSLSRNRQSTTFGGYTCAASLTPKVPGVESRGTSTVGKIKTWN
ncbi:hypothetical protein Tdes44962_MAKER07285 [Teratosphaeria destructans]|uniref:Uncharacterized protein n=1 Tax=Teratosphaeria destructans TaxID=418781 RepID=A0A9W7SZZ7_9PEZI|nr:hypothetical protein Tdes44962_MAKER07285 [Teratosphaeria destructans]